MWRAIGILPPALHADRPSAADVPVGQGWVSSDVDGGTLYVSDGTDWHEVAAGVLHDHDADYSPVVHEHDSSGGEVLMQDGVTGPPVPIETEARDDWLYEDV